MHAIGKDSVKITEEEIMGTTKKKKKCTCKKGQRMTFRHQMRKTPMLFFIGAVLLNVYACKFFIHCERAFLSTAVCQVYI